MMDDDDGCECDTGARIYLLDISAAFSQLSESEKHYAHFMREYVVSQEALILYRTDNFIGRHSMDLA